MANALNFPLLESMSSAPDAEGGAALEDFICRHAAELRRYLHSRVRNPEDADDLAQDCFARLLRYQEAHPDASLEPALLFRIANNLLTDAWRRNQVRAVEREVSCETAEIHDTAASPDQAADEQQTMALLKQVVRNLPPKCQEVFVCSRWLGMSNSEIALKLGISIKAVEKHITKALAACRAGVGSSAMGRYS